MKKLVFILFIISLLLLGGCKAKGTPTSQDSVDDNEEDEYKEAINELPKTEEPTERQIEQTQQKNPKQTQESDKIIIDKIELTVKMSKYKFDPDPIVVKEGQEVTLHVTSIDGTHGFAVAEFDVNTGEVEQGETKTVVFTASKKGKFEIRCSYFCGPGHKDMKGSLIVE